MKNIVSISIGSSLRDFEFEHEFAGVRYHVRRIGTDGDKFKALALIKEFDGKVDAIGLGGMDVASITTRIAFALFKRPKIHRLSMGSG